MAPSSSSLLSSVAPSRCRPPAPPAEPSSRSACSEISRLCLPYVSATSPVDLPHQVRLLAEDRDDLKSALLRGELALTTTTTTLTLTLALTPTLTLTLTLTLILTR